MMEAEKRGPLFSLVEASVFEFPLAVQKWMLGMGQDSSEVEDSVLKACQAWTNLANQTVEHVFQAQGFVGLMTSSVRHLVQCQRMARDFLESLVPGAAAANGAAGAAEIEELREAVGRLRQEVRALTARVNLLDRNETAEVSLH